MRARVAHVGFRNVGAGREDGSGLGSAPVAEAIEEHVDGGIVRGPVGIHVSEQGVVFGEFHRVGRRVTAGEEERVDRGLGRKSSALTAAQAPSQAASTAVSA